MRKLYNGQKSVLGTFEDMPIGCIKNSPHLFPFYRDFP